MQLGVQLVEDSRSDDAKRRCGQSDKRLDDWRYINNHTIIPDFKESSGFVV
jgi:hypothetical protein